MPVQETIVVTALRNHMKGQKVYGLNDRQYVVDLQTRRLHPLGPNGVYEIAMVHPDDAAEFATCPNDYKITTEEQTVGAKKAPPPPPGAKRFPSAGGPSHTPTPAEPSPPSVASILAAAPPDLFPEDAITWTQQDWIGEAGARGIKLSTKEKGMRVHQLVELIVSYAVAAADDAAQQEAAAAKAADEATAKAAEEAAAAEAEEKEEKAGNKKHKK